MFSLIITVISIALVAALALATLYYGGAAFNKGSADAEASKIVLQGQQLLGAADLYFADHNAWPTEAQLLSAGYLKAIPRAQAPLLAAAHAEDVEWDMPTDAVPLFRLDAAVDEETCAAVNLKGSLGKRGILLRAFPTLNAQCFGNGSTEHPFRVVFKKFSDADSLLPANLPEVARGTGAVPTDPSSPEWSRRPSTAGGAPGDGSGDGGGGGSTPAPVQYRVEYAVGSVISQTEWFPTRAEACAAYQAANSAAHPDYTWRYQASDSTCAGSGTKSALGPRQYSVSVVPPNLTASTYPIPTWFTTREAACSDAAEATQRSTGHARDYWGTVLSVTSDPASGQCNITNDFWGANGSVYRHPFLTQQVTTTERLMSTGMFVGTDGSSSGGAGTVGGGTGGSTGGGTVGPAYRADYVLDGWSWSTPWYVTKAEACGAFQSANSDFYSDFDWTYTSNETTCSGVGTQPVSYRWATARSGTWFTSRQAACTEAAAAVTRENSGNGQTYEGVASNIVEDDPATGWCRVFNRTYMDGTFEVWSGGFTYQSGSFSHTMSNSASYVQQ